MTFKDTAGAHQIQALGRSSYLGQLYDARTSTLLPGFRLFSAEQIKNNFNTVNVNKSTTSQHEVRSINDRSSSLNVSAELEVTILGGAITIGGSGSYLNSKEDTSESITVSCVAKYRTGQQTLEVNALRSEALTGEELGKTGATHFVTSITYGGDVIASLTQQSNNKVDNTDIKGSFNLEVFKGMGKAFGASGKAELTIEEREKINSFNLKVDFSGDVSLKGESIPTNAADLLTLFKKSGDLVGDGVPCEIDLLPLTMLQSDIPTYRELAVSELKQISRTYNDIIKLDNSRIWLKNSVEPKQDLFPTFFDTISDRTVAVSELVQEARSELADYLKDFRGGTMTLAKPADFKNSIERRFAEAWKQYRADLTTWRDYLERLRAAEINAFPAVSITELTTKMNRADKALIAVILVPEKVMYNDLLNNYRTLAGDIRQWRKSIEEPAKGTDGKPKEGEAPPQTEYMSIYADEQNDEALHRLDDSSGSLKSALATARKTSNIAFLTYGVGKDKLGSLGWNVLNEEGWGIIINKEENWRYIGNIKRKLPHGSGVMTFIDGTRYSGDWLNGLREGEGELLDKDGNTVPNSKGIYVRNGLVSDGVVISLTVYNKLQIPIDKRSIVLRSTDSARAHVERIGRAMGWSLKQEFKLQVDDGHSLVVNGDMIDPSEPPSTQNQFWTLKADTKITATPIGAYN
ncbi:hypothetical protein M422DRAFT_247513 [Sphaerobolus stellatus SS14]|nr:hypothetical protein M422DRAFT_247513 [Sphaerobolus stellatus SS14]